MRSKPQTQDWQRHLFQVDLTVAEVNLLESLAVGGGFTVNEIVEGFVKQSLHDWEPPARRKHALTERRHAPHAADGIVDSTGIVYASVREAAEFNNLHPRLIYAVLHGKRKHTGGLGFDYWVAPKYPPKK